MKWATIQEFPDYEVSDNGCVKRKYVQRGVSRRGPPHYSIAKFIASIEVNGNSKYLGAFPTFEEASKKYVDEYGKQHGFHPKERCILHPQLNHKGYPTVRLYKDGKWRWRTIHKLVAEAFIGLRPAGLQINHKDGNKQNNNLTNLEWESASGNIKHAYKMGLMTLSGAAKHKGSQVHNAKLNERQVKEIRGKYATGRFTTTALGKEYKVCRHTIGYIVNNKTWN